LICANIRAISLQLADREPIGSLAQRNAKARPGLESQHWIGPAEPLPKINAAKVATFSGPAGEV
jgi:hypothetical protein